MIEKFAIESFGVIVNYTSDVPLKKYFEEHKHKMELFNANVLEYQENINLPEVVYNNKFNSRNIEIINNKMIVSYPFENLTESIILYLGYHFFEYYFGLDGKCLCHSACLTKDDDTILILGDSGAGKTSVAINLCLEHGYELISNDMTLIGLEADKLFAYGGTKFINLRYTSVKQNMPMLKSLFDGISNDQWNYKINVQANEIGVKECYNPKKIDRIYTIKVINSRNDLSITPGDNWRNNFILYSNISSHIRGSAATFIDKMGHPIGFIPSFDDENTYNKRMKIIDTINSMPCYYNLSGDLHSLLNQINAQSEKNNDVDMVLKKQLTFRKDNI